jgi:thiosulfate/3-mercaptopyruvate sulfurtransferase
MMTSLTDPVLVPEQLLALLSAPDLRVIDCRYSLADVQQGPQAYRAGHLPGAVYLSLDADLSGPVGPHGGRHPLPDPARIAGRLGELGVGREHLVVVYDDSGEMAARAWWVLTYLDFPRVAVLDGGFTAWLSMGGPVVEGVPHHAPVEVAPRVRPELLVRDRAEVEAAARQGRLVDSRAGARYRGEQETLDTRAGHIPGARNLYWEAVKDPATGRYRSRDDLSRRFQELPSGEAVVYCGSGVTACPNVLALTRIGRPARLYAGSWSDWISYPDRPVAVGPECPDPDEGG